MKVKLGRKTYKLTGIDEAVYCIGYVLIPFIATIIGIAVFYMLMVALS